ncbi:hypothetical protein HYW44_03310 [Candidatus Daviesbacteria bacterium]|nr:hypothetical protein [Candidatus Daviesbacteria bacterium]
MSEGLARAPQIIGDIKEFKLTPEGKTRIQQKGRVVRLSHPEFGTTYLIDVTDRKDPTRQDPGFPGEGHETMGELFQEDLEDPRFTDRYASNNGVVVVLSDKLDSEGRKRVYVGLGTIDVSDPGHRELVSHTLHREGFRGGSFYVPFSFDSELVREYMQQEVMDAVRDTGDKSLFSDFSPPALHSGS